jgi:hypothetical protein
MRARLWAARDDIVFKSLHSPVIQREPPFDHGYVWTSRVAATELDDESIAVAPCQLQREVPVGFELRVTSIGRRHIAVRLDITDAGDPSVRDWRATSRTVKHTAWVLPEEIAMQLDVLMEALGLDFGASDWIVTPGGDYVFLEINPHGAWLWLDEALPDLGITRTLARHIEDVVEASSPHAAQAR